MNFSGRLQWFLSLPAKELRSQVEQDRDWCCVMESSKCHITCSNCFVATSQLLTTESQNYCSFLASWNETLFANITLFLLRALNVFLFCTYRHTARIGQCTLLHTETCVASALTFVQLKVLIYSIFNLLEWICRLIAFGPEEQQPRPQILSFKRFSILEVFFIVVFFCPVQTVLS